MIRMILTASAAMTLLTADSSLTDFAKGLQATADDLVGAGQMTSQQRQELAPVGDALVVPDEAEAGHERLLAEAEEGGRVHGPDEGVGDEGVHRQVGRAGILRHRHQGEPQLLGPPHEAVHEVPGVLGRADQPVDLDMVGAEGVQHPVHRQLQPLLRPSTRRACMYKCR